MNTIGKTGYLLLFFLKSCQHAFNTDENEVYFSLIEILLYCSRSGYLCVAQYEENTFVNSLLEACCFNSPVSIYIC